MDKFEQPEREVCRQGLPAVVIASAGIVLVGLLSLWVLKVAAGTIAIREFRSILFVNLDNLANPPFVTKRTGLPLFNVFSGEEATVTVTTIPGPDENPRYRPEIGKAKWALRRHSWNAEWLYDIALAYWREALRKQAELSEGGRAVRTRTVAEQDRLKQQINSYRADSFYYLNLACAQDPANGFYRRTAAELAEMIGTDPTVKQNYRLMAEKQVPGSTYMLLMQADRFKKDGRTQQALGTYSRVLSHLKTEFHLEEEFHEELRGNEDKQLGPQYLSRTLKAFEEILKDYKGYQSYIPDDAEVHLRLAEYLQNLSTSGSDEKYAKASVVERQKGIEAGHALIAQGKHSALVLYYMGNAYQVQGDLDESVKYMKRALMLRPRYKQWWLSLAGAQWAIAQEKNAEARLAREAGNSTKARLLEGKAGDYIAEADESLMMLLSLEPAHIVALNLRRAIGGGSEQWLMSFARAQWTAAQDKVAQAKLTRDAGNPDQAHLLEREARAYIAEAEKALTTLLGLEPDHNTALNLRKTIKDGKARLFE